MKLTLVISAVLLVFFASSLEASPDTDDVIEYTEEQKKAIQTLDSIDIDALIKDKDKADAEIACVLEETTCEGDHIFESIKALIPLGVVGIDCHGCTPQQRGKLIKVAKYIKYNLPNRYKQIIQRFDGGVEPPELEAL